MSKRLFFGNPEETINLKPVPKGTRLCFGEPQKEPAKPPAVPSEARFLAFGGTHPVKPTRELAVQPSDPLRALSQDPRAEKA